MKVKFRYDEESAQVVLIPQDGMQAKELELLAAFFGSCPCGVDIKPERERDLVIELRKAANHAESSTKSSDAKVPEGSQIIQGKPHCGSAMSDMQTGESKISGKSSQRE